MKLISRRAMAALILAFLLILGLLIFIFRYMDDASTWVMHPTNKHLYQDGILIASGTIYDRNGIVLSRMVDGSRRYSEDKTIRKAVMHAVGDTYGNVSTGVQVTFGERLGGWDFLNGVYHLNNNEASSSDNLTLTLDADLCKTAYRALNGRKGTVGVYNYQTGEILCMVSSPTFDPNYPPDVQSNPERYDGVYINRLLSAAYVPGSVFKLVTAAAAIDTLDNYDSKIYHCEGELILDGDKVTCPSAHGDVTLEQALAVSCNVAFAEISQELGASTLQKYAEKAGFNSGCKINGIQTAEGKIDLRNAESGDLAWAGIGQYTNTANPVNFMTYVGAIANDGVLTTPTLIENRSMTALFGSIKHGKRVLSSETAEVLGNMMRNNVVSNYGDRNYPDMNLCAKTGTAEVGGNKAPHAWFAGYMDREDCPLAFVVIIENGGSGSGAAGPVAAKVLRAALGKLE